MNECTGNSPPCCWTLLNTTRTVHFTVNRASFWKQWYWYSTCSRHVNIHSYSQLALCKFNTWGSAEKCTECPVLPRSSENSAVECHGVSAALSVKGTEEDREHESLMLIRPEPALTVFVAYLLLNNCAMNWEQPTHTSVIRTVNPFSYAPLKSTLCTLFPLVVYEVRPSHCLILREQ